MSIYYYVILSLLIYSSVFLFLRYGGKTIVLLNSVAFNYRVRFQDPVNFLNNAIKFTEQESISVGYCLSDNRELYF